MQHCISKYNKKKKKIKKKLEKASDGGSAATAWGLW